MTADKTLHHAIPHQNTHAHVVVNSEFLLVTLLSHVPQIDDSSRVDGFSRIYIP
jgi:hypothetical protein